MICTSSSKLNSQNGNFRFCGPEHVRPAVEAFGVFVVCVDQEYAQIASRLHDLTQDERKRGRFARAGGADNGEMLAHHLVDIDGRCNRGVLLQAAKFDRAGARKTENGFQFVVADAEQRRCRSSDRRRRRFESAVSAGNCPETISPSRYRPTHRPLHQPLGDLPARCRRASPMASASPFSMPTSDPTSRAPAQFAATLDAGRGDVAELRGRLRPVHRDDAA